MTEALNHIINLDEYPLADAEFRERCRQNLDEHGALVMRGFLLPEAVKQVRVEAVGHRDQAYFCQNNHTVYLSPPDSKYPEDHTRNRMVISSKGCITDDVVPANSVLRTLYNNSLFQEFLCYVLQEEALYEYADPLSSINIHYAEKGQELGWHFDNSSFAITMMIQQPDKGAEFEYVGALRDSANGDMNFDGVAAVLDGKTETRSLVMDAGALVLFRGRDAIHRVTPNEGETTRLLVVLAYNSSPGIALSEEAMKTFYGKTAQA